MAPPVGRGVKVKDKMTGTNERELEKKIQNGEIREREGKGMETWRPKGQER